jgi:hypothetical protein
MVPLCTENWLRFSAVLDDGAPEVRFERSKLSVIHGIAFLSTTRHLVSAGRATKVRKLIRCLDLEETFYHLCALLLVEPNRRFAQDLPEHEYFESFHQFLVVVFIGEA